MGPATVKECVDLFDHHWKAGMLSDAIALYEPGAVVIEAGKRYGVKDYFTHIKPACRNLNSEIIDEFDMSSDVKVLKIKWTQDVDPKEGESIAVARRNAAGWLFAYSAES